MILEDVYRVKHGTNLLLRDHFHIQKYCKGVVKKPEINFIQGPYNMCKAIQFVFNIYIRVIFWFATVIFKILFKNFLNNLINIGRV